MKLGIVILNWNAASDTERALLMVKAWRLPSGVPPPTTWVVDNASVGPEVQTLKGAHPDCRFLTSTINRGFAGGCNLGIGAAMAAGSDAVLLLNNDATLRGEDVASMLATLSAEPGVGVVGPTLWDAGRLLSTGGRDIARHVVTHIRSVELPTKLFDVDHVSGTAALVRTRVFEEVGVLDEDYFFGGEMADLCHRARERGWRCVTDPGARAQHDLQRSSAVRETLHLYYILRNRFLYVRKHHRRHRGWLCGLWSLRGATALTGALMRGEWRRARILGLGLIDGLSGRFGAQNERVLG